MEVFYTQEVSIFIKSLQKSSGSKVKRSILLIEEFGEELGRPHVKKITDVLYELRIRGKQEVRIFFVRQKKGAILLHGFIKKTQKTPKKEIEIAINRYKSLT